MRMATAKLMRTSGHRRLLIKPRVALHRMVKKVGLFIPCHLTSVSLTSGTSLMLAGDGSSIPFNTQFFHDDYDDGPGFDDGFDGDLPGTADPGEQDLLADTQGRTRRVRPEFIKYTKRAKRVDVRKLKDNIWRGLKIPTPDDQQPADTEGMVRVSEIFACGRPKLTAFFFALWQDIDRDALGVTNSEDARTFDEVIVGLQRSYPGDKLAEISTSFCFICLLHLANERGLKLETGDDAPSAVPEVKESERVGNIWSLKVSRKLLTHLSGARG